MGSSRFATVSNEGLEDMLQSYYSFDEHNEDDEYGFLTQASIAIVEGRRLGVLYPGGSQLVIL